MNRRTMMIATACAAACAAAARALPQSSDSSQRLNALFDQFMRENLDLSPLQVTYLGMDTGARATQKSAIDDGSPAGIERQKALIASQLARLKAFDREPQCLGCDQLRRHSVRAAYHRCLQQCVPLRSHGLLVGWRRTTLCAQPAHRQLSATAHVPGQSARHRNESRCGCVCRPPRWLCDCARPGDRGRAP